MAKLAIIFCALLVSTAHADEWRLNLNFPPGHNSFDYTSGASKYNHSRSKSPHRRNFHDTRPNSKPYPPYWHDPGSWYGYPRLSPWYGPRNANKKTVIIKEKEVVREVPVIIQLPEPQKTWIPPIYEEKVVPGHYTGGIKEWVDEEGYRNFTDDDSKSIWIPEHTVKVIKQEGFWQ